tara:strand:+ start:15507 stop:16472 length:966 start_codon:yes stop_codon:yes gene_type:complete
MNVLVVGGAGYIGAHIVDLLCEKKHDVVVFDNLNTGFKENLNEEAIFVRGDILNKVELENTFNAYDFDAVIHMAALKAAGESMIQSFRYTENNIIGSMNLISMAASYNVKKIIFSSTAAVYGEPIYSPIDEKHPTSPINHYGFTKLSIENYLSWMNQIEGIKYVALRYFNAAGYTTKKNLIKFLEVNPQNLIPIVLEVANKTRLELEVFGNDYNTIDGTCIRDYINVVDLANAHIKALEYIDSGESCSINLSTNKGYSVLDVIETAKKITNQPIPFKFSNRRQGDPEILISNYIEAEKKLQWFPKESSLEQIISSMWKYYK